MGPRLYVRANPLACLHRKHTDALRGRSLFSGQSDSISLKIRKPFRLAARVVPETTRRHASNARETATEARSFVTRLKNFLIGTTVGASLILGYLYITDTRAGVHQWIVVPSLRWLYDDAEDAHEAGTKALKALYSLGLHPRERGNSDSAGDLSVEVRKPLGHV